MNFPKNTDTTLPVIGLRPYDVALRDFFTMNVYPDIEKPQEYETLIPVMGPPRLEFGTIEALTGEAPAELKDNAIVKLPALSLTQLNWDFDLSRWTKAHFRKLGWTEEGYKVIQSPQLVPVEIMYQLDCWSKYRSTMNQIVRHIILKFTQREVWLKVNLGGPWGERSIPLFMMYNGPHNLTDVEPRDKDRTVRMAFTFNLNAWIIPDPYMIPAVRKIIKEYQLVDTLAGEYYKVQEGITEVEPKKANP